MRSGTLCLLIAISSTSLQVQAEGTDAAGASQPTHYSNAAGQIADLQSRLGNSERQREDLMKQVQNTERDSALLGRLRQENQKLKLQLKEALSATPPRLLTEQQQWFVAGGGVAMIALLCGIFVSGWRRQRRQWLS
ncbi:MULTISPECIES: translation initiation factor 2 [Pseudomonas]|uniref:translation initiation factor 2 n=1 Tax=Pseudomonas TaxID=286 RepID=UPI000C0742E4|nr:MULTISPECIES: translation initiation factor 2 [Pseudomonas]MBP0952267.1 translation initiation factor 2 [Pseudomonas alliivorans]MEE4914021.1 translation initiation factor 2 [Pseudomonas alliivorans]MEE5106352.1 translation initiation factor 2 [Pseudomonas alliivorans]MEE5170811.1 translation initiation factor 2 [Pseudomonas alliivorans]PHN58234.1 translation initiation factor 2 [Pseudomonas viridiflava]